MLGKLDHSHHPKAHSTHHHSRCPHNHSTLVEPVVARVVVVLVVLVVVSLLGQVEAEEIAASSSAVSPWFSMVGMVVTCRSDGWAWVEVGV